MLIIEIYGKAIQSTILLLLLKKGVYGQLMFRDFGNAFDKVSIIVCFSRLNYLFISKEGCVRKFCFETSE